MKSLTLLILFLCVGLSLAAQDLPHVVCLKDGTQVRGTIVQIVSDDFVEIKSGDGEIYKYKMSEVAKIGKNTPASYLEKPSTSELFSSEKKYRDGKGYRGFFDFSYSSGIHNSEVVRLEAATSQGYQFNSYLYLGAGIGASCFLNDATTTFFPVFANPRVDFNTGKISPFIDLRGGYTFGDSKGIYLVPSVGARLRLAKGGLNFSAGYTWQQADFLEITPMYKQVIVSRNVGEITLRVGIDF